MPEKRGGRKRLIECTPGLAPAFKAVLQEHVAGDPMKPDCLWTNLSLQAISRLMSAAGLHASPYTVGQLLHDCKLGHRQAFKYLAMRQHKDRRQQFDILGSYKQGFLASPNPILSIDTKKKELLGLFHRKGRLFTAEGRAAYPQAEELLLLCDGGGSNSASQHLFKEDLQKLADRMGVAIRVAHYPPYCSKYNPIEHRLFPHLTRACQGIILECVEQARHYMSKATTRTGLEVVVNILDHVYETGRKVADGFKKTMRLAFDQVLPKFNYKAVPASA